MTGWIEVKFFGQSALQPVSADLIIDRCRRGKIFVDERKDAFFKVIFLDEVVDHGTAYFE